MNTVSIKTHVDTMPDNSEIVHYDNPGIPLYIRKGLLSDFHGMKAQCHWHDEIELILILENEMNYYAAGKNILLHTGDSILINSRQLHYGYASKGYDCSFICILFHPSLISPGDQIFLRYVDPFISRTDIPFLYFEQKNTCDISHDILRMWDLKKSGVPFYELDVTGTLYSLWARICRLTPTSAADTPCDAPSDVAVLRKMVSFIHDHYNEKLTLHDIASAGSICSSKCCSVFSQQTHQSPFEFLNSYRLRVSADSLMRTDRSITDIAYDCGFNHLSYYSKMFVRYFNCTPREYRRRRHS